MDFCVSINCGIMPYSMEKENSSSPFVVDHGNFFSNTPFVLKTLWIK